LYYTISHTNARFEAHKNGAAYVGLYMPDIDALASEGARFPADIIFEVGKKVAKQWQGGKTIRITCDKGTNISAQILDPLNNVVGDGTIAEPDGEPVYLRRVKIKPGKWRGLFGNFAGGNGVVGMWPAWTAEGVIYFDAAHTFKGRLTKPLKYTVEKGRVVKVEGEQDKVDFFEGIFRQFGEDSRHLAATRVPFIVEWEAVSTQSAQSSPGSIWITGLKSQQYILMILSVWRKGNCWSTTKIRKSWHCLKHITLPYRIGISPNKGLPCRNSSITSWSVWFVWQLGLYFS
jgi:hypothetical protein